MYTLITGTTSGIGRELTKIFAKNGYNLIIIDKYSEKLKEQKEYLEKKYNILVKFIVKDLSKENSSKEIYNEVKKENINIDILINNAGFGTFGNYIDIDFNKNKDLIMVNVYTIMELSYLFGKDMAKRKKGKIVNISSIASFLSGPYMATYYASKAFVRSFSESLCEELKKHNVKVITICPGPTKTNFEEKADMKGSYMFKLLKVDSAYTVARKSYKAIIKNKPVYVVGFINKLFTFLTRFLSLKISRKIAMIINKGDININ